MKDIKISDDIEVSKKLDEYILKGLDEGIEIKNNDRDILEKAKSSDEVGKENTHKRPYLKVAMLVATISAATITGVYAVDKIIDYFKYNKDSIYKYEENKMEKYAQVINKSKKHDGVELRLDTVTADDSYIVVNYTVTSDKKISEFKGELDKNISMANPFVRLLKGDKEVFDGGNMESEATVISDYELKGMMRFRVGRYNLKDGDKLTIDTWEVFGIEKDWSIDFKLNKKSTSKDSKKYNINKSMTITRNLEHEGEVLEIKNKITVENIVLAPLGNTITITEEVDSPEADYLPNIGTSFELFDENNKHLPIIDNGASVPDKPNKPVTSTYEFVCTDKDTKSITLIPRDYEEGVLNSLLDVQTLDNIPIRFKLSEYGSIIVDSFKVTEDKIKYSYKKEGFVSDRADLVLFDNNGEIIIFEDSFSKESIDRENNKVDVIIDLESKIDKEKAKNIRGITLYSESNAKLMDDNKIIIDIK